MPVRLRLTLLYVGLFAAAFLALAALLDVLFRRGLYAQVDERIAAQARGTARLLGEDLAAYRRGAPGWRGWPLAAEDDDEPEVIDRLQEAEALTPDIYVQLLDPAGRTISASRNLGPARLADGAPGSGFATLRHPELGPLRVCVLAVPSPYGVFRVATGASLRPVMGAIGTLQRALLVLSPLLLLGVAALGHVLAAQALRGVAAITATAQRIRAGDLSQRIALPGPPDELKRLADTFDEMIASIERLLATERQFLADASHELRTPLTVICAALETCLRSRETDPARFRETLEVIDAEAREMHRLVEDVLTLARADAGQLLLERERVALAEVAKEACEAAAWVLRSRRLWMDLDEEVTVLGDPGRLRQLVLNLLTNAARHTPEEGEVRVSVHRSGDEATLTVEDNGEGIPPEHLPHIFERFYRADRSRSRQQGGAGLGLAICRSIAEAHGGSIAAVSAPGRGTRITVSLPAEKPGA